MSMGYLAEVRVIVEVLYTKFGHLFFKAYFTVFLSYVAAVYDSKWYVAQVEGEEPENECPGFTLLKYMERKGENQFVWGDGKDTLKTIDKDILRIVDPPSPCPPGSLASQRRL